MCEKKNEESKENKNMDILTDALTEVNGVNLLLHKKRKIQYEKESLIKSFKSFGRASQFFKASLSKFLQSRGCPIKTNFSFPGLLKSVQ